MTGAGDMGVMFMRIGNETKRKARRLAQLRGVSLAELVRRAVERELHEHETGSTQPPGGDHG